MIGSHTTQPETTDPAPEVSVVITTRGRCEELRVAIQSCLAQTDVRLEVLVYDDDSRDGTQGMVTTVFPDVRYFRNDQSSGYIVLRNRGFRDARSPYVISLDDDAWFTSPTTVAEVVGAFTEAPNTAAFALCYIETPSESQMVLMPELVSGSELRSYIGCAHAIRRSLAVSLGGYREFFMHQGEERDLCIRLRDEGYSIQFLNTAPIVHAPSPRRDRTRWHYYGIRNTFLFTILNVPAGFVSFRLLADLALLSRHAVRVGRVTGLGWVIKGLVSSLRYLPRRRSVATETYLVYRSLGAAGPSGVFNTTGNRGIYEASNTEAVMASKQCRG